MDTEWSFDAQHSSVSFAVRHFLVSQVRGRFSRWSGSLRFDARNPARSAVSVEIDATSVDTGEPVRDADLRSANFLEAARFPFITFRSNAVRRVGDGTLEVQGDLSIRGVTRPVVLHVEFGGAMRDPSGSERAGFSARTRIDRKDFGITFNHCLDHGGIALGEEVAIEIDVEATRAFAHASRSAVL
jgi:polyisoprenoid-binding protein YceI